MFIKINKVRAWFSQKTVSFTVKHQIIVDNFDDIESLDSKIQTIFKKSELVIDETKSPNPSEETMYYQVINKNKLSFFISVAASRESDELTNLILKIEYQIAYRDVKQKWEDFLMLQQKIFNLYSCDVHEKPRFEVWIKTGNTQFNPFYRLTIRHLTNVRIDNFKLTYSDDNLKVTSTLHQIYAKSDSYIAIKKMIDEYVPLSNVL
ncbi:hypothetical protein EFN29_07480 [Leuconostoc citreum]|nr:hypothetical protein [Leuconostoc citreum]MCT3061298.1 hypothetical protein [Leuconostoc citreum]